MTEPTSVSERSISDDDRRVMAEYEAIRRGAGLVTLAWASVENALVRVLAAIIENPSYEIASAIYFSPFGLDARLKIVDSAFKALLLPEPLRKSLVGEWTGEMNSLSRLKGTRNKVAHGELNLHTADSVAERR